MTAQNPSYYVFDNLIDASATSTDKLDQPITAEIAAPFSNSNAAGIIAPMSFEQIGNHARAFGQLCKSMLQADA